MKNFTVNMKEKDLPEEWKALLEMYAQGDGEEVFSSMLDDLLYLAALIDLQSDYIKLMELRAGAVPVGFSNFPREVKHQAEEILIKWEDYAQPTI